MNSNVLTYSAGSRYWYRFLIYLFCGSASILGCFIKLAFILVHGLDQDLGRSNIKHTISNLQCRIFEKHRMYCMTLDGSAGAVNSLSRQEDIPLLEDTTGKFFKSIRQL
jgi:hypothetical protein